MKRLMFIFALIFGCTKLAYESDSGMLNSAQANSYEYLARINGKVCKDIDNLVGLCAKRIKSDEKLIISYDSRPYDYRLQVTCSSSIGYSETFDVLKEKKFQVEIPHQGKARAFSCTSEVFPLDREISVSAKTNVTVRTVDANYQPRESIYLLGHNKRQHLIFGAHAKYVTMDGRHKSRKTTMRVKDDPSSAYSESEIMRFNYYGY